jgi:hypothetical protein
LTPRQAEISHARLRIENGFSELGHRDICRVFSQFSMNGALSFLLRILIGMERLFRR